LRGEIGCGVAECRADGVQSREQMLPPALALVVPWKYAYQPYVKWPTRKPVVDQLPQARNA